MTAMIHSLTPPVTIFSLVLVKTVCRTTRKRDKKVIADEGEPDEKSIRLVDDGHQQVGRREIEMKRGHDPLAYR